jgi:hypothetical protein
MYLILFIRVDGSRLNSLIEKVHYIRIVVDSWLCKKYTRLFLFSDFA